MYIRKRDQDLLKTSFKNAYKLCQPADTKIYAKKSI